MSIKAPSNRGVYLTRTPPRHSIKVLGMSQKKRKLDEPPSMWRAAASSQQIESSAHNRTINCRVHQVEHIRHNTDQTRPVQIDVTLNAPSLRPLCATGGTTTRREPLTTFIGTIHSVIRALPQAHTTNLRARSEVA